MIIPAACRSRSAPATGYFPPRPARRIQKGYIIMKKTVTPSDGARLVFLFFVGTFFTAAISSFLLGLALRNAYDVGIGYFVSADRSLLPTLWGAVTAVMAAGLCLILFLGRSAVFDSPKDLLQGESFHPMLRLPEIFLACAILFQSWICYVSNSSFFGTVFVVLSFISVLYLILPFFRVCNVFLRVIPGFAWILRELARFVISYTDKTVPMNQPIKLIDEFLCFFIMLSVLSELRYPLGKPRPVRFLLFAAPAAILSLSLPFGLLMSGYFDRFSDQIAFLLAYALFIFGRLVAVASSVVDNPDPDGSDGTASTDGEVNG